LSQVSTEGPTTESLRVVNVGRVVIDINSEVEWEPG